MRDFDEITLKGKLAIFIAIIMSTAAFFIHEAPHVLFHTDAVKDIQQMIITMAFYISCAITFLAGFTIMKAEKNSGSSTRTNPIIYIIMMGCSVLAIFFSWAITYLVPFVLMFFVSIDFRNKRKSQTTSWTDYVLITISIIETTAIIGFTTYPYYQPIII